MSHIDHEFQELKRMIVCYIAHAIEFHGEPCMAEYYDFYLKQQCLSGTDGIQVRVENGEVLLGEDQVQITNLRDLAVIAESLSPKRLN